MKFGSVLWASLVLVVSVALLERWNEDVAMALAVLTLLAILFAYPTAVQSIVDLLPKPKPTGG